MKRAFLVAVIFSHSLFAHDWKTLHRVSIISLYTTTTIDALSSYNHMELNPLLRSQDGRFKMKGVGIKFSLVGGSHLVQSKLSTTRGRRKLSTIMNFTVSGLLAGVSIRNFQVR